jgi:hypothetical protein
MKKQNIKLAAKQIENLAAAAKEIKTYIMIDKGQLPLQRMLIFTTKCSQRRV